MNIGLDFIFLVSIALFVALWIAFVLESKPFVMIISLGIMAVGVDVLITGMESVNDLLTLTHGSIYVVLGFYVFMRSALEEPINILNNSR